MKLFALVIFAALALSVDSRAPACGISNKLKGYLPRSHDGRIVNGDSVPECDVMPWMARVLINWEPCGGSIVSSNHILTAAHCIDEIDLQKDEVKVIIGDVDARDHNEKHEVMIDVVSIKKHPDYNIYTLENDLAILTLEQPIEWTNQCVRPICLDSTLDFDGYTCTVAGYGQTDFEGTLSGKLLMTHLKTHTSQKACVNAFGIPADFASLIFDESMICAGVASGLQDSCQGDSGGPLVCYDNRRSRFVQAGIVSFGKYCAVKHHPGIYTKVKSYVSWIRQNIGEA